LIGPSFQELRGTQLLPHFVSVKDALDTSTLRPHALQHPRTAAALERNYQLPLPVASEEAGVRRSTGPKQIVIESERHLRDEGNSFRVIADALGVGKERSE
jgi:hypothetical protein